MADINVRSTYGYSSTDNSGIIESALSAQSGSGNTLVFDTNGGANPSWPIRSQVRVDNLTDVTILLEDGVVLQADNSNNYWNTNRVQPMFLFYGSTNLSWIGYGAEINFPSNFYNPGDSGEWSHTISLVVKSNPGPSDLLVHTNVSIKGIFFNQSGGDGIYVNKVNGLLVEDCDFDQHTRQGISVIATEGGTNTIQYCRFARTNVKDPRAGIDFEPNSTTTDVAGTWLVQQCTSEENDGWGFMMALIYATDQYQDMDITVQDCHVRENSQNSGWAADFRAELGCTWMGSTKVGGVIQNSNDPPGGTLLWQRIAVQDSDAPAISCGNSYAAGQMQVTYRDICAWNIGRTGDLQAIRCVGSGAYYAQDLGNIEFDNVLVDMTGNDFLFAFRSTNTVTNVTGYIFGVNDDNKWYDSGPTQPAGLTIEQNTNLNGSPTTVTVATQVSEAIKSSSQNGVFRITRSSSRTDYPLLVNFTLDFDNGTIKEFDDIHHIPRAVVIPSGQTFVDVNVVARNDGNTDPDRTLQMELVNAGKAGLYTVGTPATASVTITDTGGGVSNTAPVITRLGSSVVQVVKDASYVDEGATASDAEDGDITGSIVTVNPVNTSVVGTYIVTYNVQDSGGLDAVEVTRTVQVVEATAGDAFNVAAKIQLGTGQIGGLFLPK